MLIKALIPPIILSGAHKLKSWSHQTRQVLFDGNGEAFCRAILGCNIYAEYGCGYSTEYVLTNTHARVYTVDTSKSWADRIASIPVSDKSRLHVQWIDVGEIGDWGMPVDFSGWRAYKEYTDWVWQQGVEPDLVLIDGRFRIACFLTSFLNARDGTILVFDDYVDRPKYHIVEEVLQPQMLSGRQAVFEVPVRGVRVKDLAKEMLIYFRAVRD